jgi:hypothetical protein
VLDELPKLPLLLERELLPLVLEFPEVDVWPNRFPNMPVEPDFNAEEVTPLERLNWAHAGAGISNTATITTVTASK